MDIHQLCEARFSARKYTSVKVSDEDLAYILDCVRLAPSAVNRQPWKFVVVKSRPLLRQIAGSLPNTRLTSAACAIVVCGDMTKTLDGVDRDFWIHDCSAATENILLAAHALGLGAVWTGIFPNPDRVDKLRGLTDIPETQIPLCVIAIGRPAESPAPKDKWNPENYRMIE